MLRRLAAFLFTKGYVSSGLKLLNDATSLGTGSRNIIFTGTGANRIFKGITQRSTILGSKTLENVGDGYGGLGNATDVSALGSIFRVLGAVFYIGAGRLFFNGTDTGTSATSTLKLKRVISGVLGTEYDAGLPQPSAPTIAAISPPAGFTGRNDGTVSVKVARVRSATGARSIASDTSNVVQCRNQSVLVTLPLASPNGQDYWEIDVTLNGFGGVGNHYYLKEIAEADVVGSITPSATIEDSTTIKVANSVTYPATQTPPQVPPPPALSSAQVGFKVEGTYQWKYLTVTLTGTVGAGDVKTVITGAGMTGSPITKTFAVGAGATAADIAEDLYDAINGDANIVGVSAPFEVYRDGATVYLKKKSGTDATMNFTLQEADAPATPATNITWVTTAPTGSINTWIAAVGADDSGGAGFREIVLTGAIGVYPGSSETVTITNAVDGVPRSIAIEWADGDLAGADLAPIYDYPPPAGMFGGVIGDVVFVDGVFGDTVDVVAGTSNTTPTYVGNAIAISEPTRPESFSPDNYIFTNDAPVAILAGSQGLYWRFGKNSLGVIRYIGNSPALSYERIWTGMGIRNQNNCTLAGGGRLYAYTGARGAIRVGNGGEPDTFFAAAVADDMANWNPSNVVLGYDANYQYVFYAHEKTILAYFEPMDMWCAPLDVSATLGNKTIRAMVTFNSEVYIAAGNNSSIDLYSFDTGTGTVAIAATQWQQSALEADIVSRVKVGLTADADGTATVSYYTNGVETPVITQNFGVRNGLQLPTTLRPNIRNARMWKLHSTLASTGQTAGWQNIMVDGESSGITI
jgi:hypothetical protein